MSKVADYNHELENASQACGIVREVLDVSYAKAIEAVNKMETKGISNLSEQLEKNLTPRELAFVLANNIVDETEQEQNPLMALMQAMSERSK